MTHADVVVVGAGFAGLACAAGLARRGLRVVVLERKRGPGIGMHTTGIMVKEAAAGLDLPGDLVRRVSGVRLYSPRFARLAIDSPDYFFLATDTPGLMAHLSSDAERAGAEIRYGSAYRGAERHGDAIHLTGHGIDSRWLVGADGPRSRVAEDFALGRNPAFLLGAEAEHEGLVLDDPDAFHCFIGRTFAPGYIGWVVPGVGITQVGLATRLPAKPDLEGFTARIAKLFDLRSGRIVARRGGLIPVDGVVDPVADRNVLLVGDAAGSVSPLTGGGIHTALHYGDLLASLIADRETDPTSPEPAAALAALLPRYRVKKALRWSLEHLAADWMVDGLIASPPFRALARAVFYRSKRLPEAVKP